MFFSHLLLWIKKFFSAINNRLVAGWAFWKDVFCKDFTKKLDEIYDLQNQKSKSKEDILQLYHLFQWCQKPSLIWPNHFKLELNFGEILFCILIHETVPIYEEIGDVVNNTKGKGPSINDITHFWDFWPLPSPRHPFY